MSYRHLISHRWSIAIVTLVAVGSALLVSLRSEPVYEATASVLVQPTESLGTPVSGISEPNLATEARLAASTGVAEDVASRLGIREEPDELLDDLTVESVTETEILRFRVEDEDPRRAARLAQAFAEEYLAARDRELTEGAAATAEALREDVAELERELRNLSEEILAADRSLRGLLRSRAMLLNDLLVDRTVDAIQLPGDARWGRVVQPAAVPDTPIRPDHRMNVLLGAVVGAAIGAGQALLRGRMSRRIRSIEQLEDLTAAPVLGAIPPFRTKARRRGVPLVTDRTTSREVVEAFRLLRESVMATAARRGGRILLVTSAEPGTSRQVVAMNLSVSLATSGRRATLVTDGRERGNDVHPGLAGRPGLLEAVAGDARVSDLLLTHASGMRILPYGTPSDGEPAEPVGARAVSLLDELAGQADLVVVDTPAMLRSADAAALAAGAAGVLLVVDAHGADPSALWSARRQLDRVGASLWGTVVTGTTLHRLEARSRGEMPDVLEDGAGRRSAAPLPSPGGRR